MARHPTLVMVVVLLAALSPALNDQFRARTIVPAGWYTTTPAALYFSDGEGHFCGPLQARLSGKPGHLDRVPNDDVEGNCMVNGRPSFGWYSDGRHRVIALDRSSRRCISNWEEFLASTTAGPQAVVTSAGFRWSALEDVPPCRAPTPPSPGFYRIDGELFRYQGRHWCHFPSWEAFMEAGGQNGTWTSRSTLPLEVREVPDCRTLTQP